MHNVTLWLDSGGHPKGEVSQTKKAIVLYRPACITKWGYMPSLGHMDNKKQQIQYTYRMFTIMLYRPLYDKKTLKLTINQIIPSLRF